MKPSSSTDTATSRAQPPSPTRWSEDEVGRRSVRTAVRVLRNQPEIEHGFDRLVAAAAILIGSCKGWSDPKDRRVVEMAERIAAVERDGLPPAKVTPEQQAEGDRVWHHARAELTQPTAPFSGLNRAWLDQLRAIGIVDGTLWLIGRKSAAHWARRRYLTKLRELLDVDVKIINEGSTR